MHGVSVAGWAAAGLAVLLLAGCQVDEHKNGDGKDVKIATPFGGVSVKTDNATVLEAIGLPGYPSAVAVKKDSGNDSNDSADVNMSFGSFQLRVKAASYRTDDAPGKVEAFYRNGLKRFGTVIACRNNQPVGTPAQTAEGLNCDNEKENHISVDASRGNDKLELKAGSKQHQHIVGLEPDGGGTKFELVALDLPGKVFSGDEDSRDKQ
jgi:hypothetical protein